MRWAVVVAYAILGLLLIFVGAPYHHQTGHNIHALAELLLGGLVFYCAWLRLKMK